MTVARRCPPFLPALLPCLLLAACATPRDVEVRQIGGMREVMRDGRTGPRVRLADLPLTPGTIGVGALAGLAGEVTIAGGELWLAVPDGEGIQQQRAPATFAATLLTVADAGSFAPGTCAGALDEAALVAWLQQQAPRLGLDPARPQPLWIDGMADELELHVVRGGCPRSGDAGPAAWQWSAPGGTPVTLVGFHAPGQEGVMTHHGSALHLHAIVGGGGAPGEAVSGHVDSFRLQPGATIRIGVRG